VDDIVNDTFARANDLHEVAHGLDRDARDMPNDPLEEHVGLNLDDKEFLIHEST